mgnify:CR=1 FL=1
MKTVLVISGSPRKKGNTMEIVKRIEEDSLKIDPTVRFDYIHLIDRNLGFCRGCSRCLTRGGDACPLKDDKSDLLDSMRKADGLIFASPGYSHMVSALYKNFMDRFMYLDHIPELINKPALIVSTTGGDGVSGTPEYMNRKSVLWWGCDIVDTIGVAHAFYTINRRYHEKINKRLNRSAGRFLETMESGTKRKPTFGQYMCFKQNQAELIISPDAMPYRTEIWNENGWMKQDYYYSVKVNPLYRIIGSSMILMVSVMYRLMIGKDMSGKMRQYLCEN